MPDLLGAKEKVLGQFLDWGGRAYNTKHDNAGMHLDSILDDRDALHTLVNVTMQPAGGVVDVAGVPRIASALTVPANVRLNFVNGSYLAPDLGIVVTINGSINRHMEKKFGGGGSIAFGSAKAVPYLCPEWWGADADGVVDATSSCQAAATALKSGQKFVCGGSYKVNGQITVGTAGVTLSLSKGTFTQIGANKSTIILNAISDVEVWGGRFIGKGTEHNGANTAWNGVAAIAMKNGCSNIDIHHVKATGHAGGSIRWDTSISGLNVHHCKLAGIGAAGGIVANDNNDDVAVGGYATTPDNDVMISKNDLSGHCFGIQVAFGVGCIIEGNNIHDIPGQHGIYNAAQSKVLIENNIIRDVALIGCKNQIAVAATICTDIVVQNNHVTNCGQTGISTQAVTFTTSYYLRVKVSGNHVYNCGTSYGIQCDYAREYECSENKITQCGAYGILLQHWYGEVKNNTIRMTSWNAISSTSALHDFEISGNKIIDPVQNFLAIPDNNIVRYGMFLQKDAASLVANPKALIFGNTFRNTLAEGGFYLGNVFVATGLFTYYYGGNKNLTSKGLVMQTATDLQQCEVIGDVQPTYGAAVAINRSLGNTFNIIATNGVAFAVSAPTNHTPGLFTLRIKNTSGGALGVGTFNAAYKTSGAWVQPATGFHRDITFYYDGTTIGEVSRTAVDIAN